MEAIIERQESQAEKLTRISEEIKASIDFFTDALDKATEQACAALKEIAIAPLATPPTSKLATYADALKNGTPAPHAEILAASEAQTRQVTIKCEMTDLYNLSERELVLKANIALENMTSEEDFPTGGRFLSARKQKGMKICLELNAQENAEWLKGKKTNQDAFLQLFGTNASFVPKTYKAVVEFVPITLNADLPSSIRSIEGASNLDNETLKAINWIKPPRFRKPNQRVAHAIVSFASREAANKALRNGLNIEGKKVSAHKQLPEPNRCFDCHSLDQSHLAKDCPNEATCGTCGAHHTTEACEVTNSSNFYCVNCKSHGHAAWSRDCKAFNEARKKLWASNREANYKYFPTPNDPTTWETINGNLVDPRTTPTSPKDLTPRTPTRVLPPPTARHSSLSPPRNTQRSQRRPQNGNPPLGTRDAGWNNRHQARIDDYYHDQPAQPERPPRNDQTNNNSTQYSPSRPMEAQSDIEDFESFDVDTCL